MCGYYILDKIKRKLYEIQSYAVELNMGYFAQGYFCKLTCKIRIIFNIEGMLTFSSSMGHLYQLMS